MPNAEELRDIALVEFARAGYAATSLQRIAELAGTSKSSILYHFASKEALLEAGLASAFGRFEQLVDGLGPAATSIEGREAFIAQFVDLLLDHTLELHMFINQGRPSLEDVAIIERANELVVRIASFFTASTQSVEERMRFGVALGGAAYTLATQQQFSLRAAETAADTPEETRAALITIVTELLSPVPVRSTTL